MKTKELGCTVTTKVNLGNFETLDVSFNKVVVLDEHDAEYEAEIKATLLSDVRKGCHEQILLFKQQVRENKAGYHA